MLGGDNNDKIYIGKSGKIKNVETNLEATPQMLWSWRFCGAFVGFQLTNYLHILNPVRYSVGHVTSFSGLKIATPPPQWLHIQTTSHRWGNGGVWKFSAKSGDLATLSCVCKHYQFLHVALNQTIKFSKLKIQKVRVAQMLWMRTF